MQLRITENLKKNIRTLLFEFAVRLPKIKNEELYDTYPELANRFFDTMNIQKGTSKLLIDFSAAFVAKLFSVLFLLSYHPYFIVLDSYCSYCCFYF
jgi:hypothetical protein